MFKKLFDYTQPLVAGATVLGISLILVGLIAGFTAYRVKMSGDTVQVTGSARTSVSADYGRWTIQLATHTPVGNAQEGISRLSRASDTIFAYLKKQGFEDVEALSSSVNDDYSYPQNSAPVLTGHSVSRSIIVRSEDIGKLRVLAENIAPFSGEGYTVSTFGLELTYRELDAMRVSLLSDAIKDARARAEAIAKESGRSVGSLVSSASGVVQVLPQGGVDISDYGTYDTQSEKKDIMVTVRASFSLK
jgi:hypothetical protein